MKKKSIFLVSGGICAQCAQDEKKIDFFGFWGDLCAVRTR
jgi:hypothetical protein